MTITIIISWDDAQLNTSSLNLSSILQDVEEMNPLPKCRSLNGQRQGQVGVSMPFGLVHVSLHFCLNNPFPLFYVVASSLLYIYYMMYDLLIKWPHIHYNE